MMLYGAALEEKQQRAELAPPALQCGPSNKFE
jgi:hypothetical protein